MEISAAGRAFCRKSVVAIHFRGPSSTISRTQQQSFLAGFLFVLPAVLLSGVMSPIRAMPWWLEAVTWVNPVRHYAEVARGCLLRGAGFGDLAVQLIALAVLGGGVFALAVARFRTRLG